MHPQTVKLIYQNRMIHQVKSFAKVGKQDASIAMAVVKRLYSEASKRALA